MSGCQKTHEAGFTLLELLVSLVLTALLMVAMPAALTLAKRTAAAGHELDRDAAIEAVAGFIEHRLSEATAIYDRGDDGRLHVIFKGDPDALGFVAPIKFVTGDAGLAKLDLKISSDEEGHNGLVMVWTPWRPQQSGEQPSPAPTSKSRLIVPDATKFEVRYLGSASASEKPAWTDAWTRTDAIPDLVEFRFYKSGSRILDSGLRRVVLHLRLP